MSFRFWSHVAIGSDEECWLWTGCTTACGYGRASRYGGANVLAHRLAYELAVGEVPDGLCVMHVCDTPACVNPAHLRLGTQRDNVADCVAKGRTAHGEKNGRAKLTSADVRAIRGAVRRGASQRAVADDFEVCPKTVSRITRGLTWRHVQ